MTSAIFGSILAILTISVLGLMIYYRYKDSQSQTDGGMLNPEQFAFSTVHQASRGCTITETTQAWSWQSVGVDQFGHKKWQQPAMPTLDRVADAKTLYRIESCNTGKFSDSSLSESRAVHEWLVYKPDFSVWPCEPLNGKWKVADAATNSDAVGIQYSVWIIKDHPTKPGKKNLYLPDMRSLTKYYDTQGHPNPVQTAFRGRIEIADALTDHLKDQGCFSIKADNGNYYSRYCTPKTTLANGEVVNGQAVCDFKERSITASSTLDEKSATAWRFEPLCPGIESIVAPSWNRLLGTPMPKPTTVASKDTLFRIESCAHRGMYIAFKPTSPSAWSCNPKMADGKFELVSLDGEQYSVFIKKDSRIYLAIPFESEYLDWQVSADSKLQIFAGEVIPSLIEGHRQSTITDAFGKTYPGDCKAFKTTTSTPNTYLAYNEATGLYPLPHNPNGVNYMNPATKATASWRLEGV